MKSPVSAKPEYVMGHDDRERRRLSLQANFINPITEDFLRRAGICSGMRVLDLGCGVGEVSFVAAGLVGSSGHVTGIDIDEGALKIARSRADREKAHNVSFEVRDCTVPSTEPYDAVIGRHILIHMRDPFEVIRYAVSRVRVGGIVAFQEYDFSNYIAGFPEIPLFEHHKKLFHKFFDAVGLKANMGAQLFQLMQSAGLPQPECRLEACMSGGSDSSFYQWIAESLRSILPRLEALGWVTAAEV